MEPTSQGRSTVNIGATVAKHRDIVPFLLSAHAVTGCDTVACYYGIDKGKAVKVLQGGVTFSHIGYPSANMEAVIEQATAFITACYGQNMKVKQCLMCAIKSGFQGQ